VHLENFFISEDIQDLPRHFWEEPCFECNPHDIIRITW